MFQLRSVGPLVLLGLAIGACTSESPDFQRGPDDGHRDGHGEENGHGDPLAGDRVAYWEMTRTAGFDSDDADYGTRAAFFTPQRLGFPRPDGMGDCKVNLNAPVDPWAPPVTELNWGAPAMLLDGENWTLELTTVDQYWNRGLPPRTWEEFSDVDLSVPASPYGDVQWVAALPVPETLLGVGASLTADGIELLWEGSEPTNPVTAIVRGRQGEGGQYVVCMTNDDGEFVVPGELLAQLTVADVKVELRREREWDAWPVDAYGVGRTLGISRLEAGFSIPTGWFDEPE